MTTLSAAPPVMEEFPAARVAPAGSHTHRTPNGRPTPRVLIIDDSRDAADSMQLVLDLLGYETQVAYCGRSGLLTALDWAPDVTLCDIGLPGMSGYDVARAMRSHALTASMLLIAVTGYGTAEDQRRAIASGFNHHLTKPVDMPALLRLLPRAAR